MVRAPPVEHLTSLLIGIGLEMCPHPVVLTALGTSTRFNTENADGSRTEIGLESDGTFTRQFECNFDADGNFTGGTETENGVTYALDANWNRKVSVEIDNLTAVTDGIDDIPAVLKADTDGDGTVDAVYQQVLRDDSDQQYGGKETAYFDATGNMLGKSFEFKDVWSGEQITSFETIDAMVCMNGLGMSVSVLR